MNLVGQLLTGDFIFKYGASQDDVDVKEANMKHRFCCLTRFRDLVESQILNFTANFFQKCLRQL